MRISNTLLGEVYHNSDLPEEYNLGILASERNELDLSNSEIASKVINADFSSSTRNKIQVQAVGFDLYRTGTMSKKDVLRRVIIMSRIDMHDFGLSIRGYVILDKMIFVSVRVTSRMVRLSDVLNGNGGAVSLNLHTIVNNLAETITHISVYGQGYGNINIDNIFIGKTSRVLLGLCDLQNKDVSVNQDHEDIQNVIKSLMKVLDDKDDELSKLYSLAEAGEINISTPEGFIRAVVQHLKPLRI